MKHAFSILVRLAVVSSTALGLATIASWFNYRGYWHGTIGRVQTVDFNILSHTLPTKLSYTLINQDIEELQRTLNSNYGLFGIVVTDCLSIEPECPNQKILYSSDSKFSWKQQLNLETLSKLPYSTLQNPPPLWAEGRFDTPRDPTWKLTGKTNNGKIIGRVYYVRGIPPTFRADLVKWIKKLPTNLLTDSGTNKYYSLTFSLFLIGGLTTWVSIESILYRKRVQEQIACQKQKRLEREKEIVLCEAKKLREELKEWLQEIPTLIAQREQIRADLKHYQEEAKQRTYQLEDELVQIKNELLQSQNRQKKQLEEALQNRTKAEIMLQTQEKIISELQQLIIEQEQKQEKNVEVSKQFKAELAKAQNRQAELHKELFEQTESISKLQEKIAFQEQTYEQDIVLQEQELQQAQEKLIQAQQQVEQQNQFLEKLITEQSQTEQRVQVLSQQLESMPDVEELKRQLERLKAELDGERHSNKEFKELIEYADREYEELKAKLVELENQKAQLSQQYDELQLLLAELEDRLEHYQQQESAACRRQRSADLSSKRLALIGGHQDIRRRVIESLYNNYGLHVYVEVPPSSERQISHRLVKARVESADLIAVITRYIGHDLTNIVSDLETNRVIRGQVLWIRNCRGTSGVVREIVDYLFSQN